jgi:high-affinity iron transporter
MLSALLIALREGLEAALIVSIIAAYLVRSGRRAELRGVWLGVAAAVAISVVAGLVIAAGAAVLSHRAQELYEGAAGVIAVAVLTWMIFFMRKHARSQKPELESAAAGALSSGHPNAIRVLAFTAVVREGLETVLFMNAAFTSSSSPGATGAGAVIGLVIAVALAYGMYRGGIKLNLRRFFQITGGFMILVGAGLLSSSIHEFNEGGVLNILTTQAWDVSGVIGPTGVIGSVLRGLLGYEARPTVLQVLVWWGYLIPTLIAFYGMPRMLTRTAVAERS